MEYLTPPIVIALVSVVVTVVGIVLMRYWGRRRPPPVFLVRVEDDAGQPVPGAEVLTNACTVRADAHGIAHVPAEAGGTMVRVQTQDRPVTDLMPLARRDDGAIPTLVVRSGKGPHGND